MTTVLRTIIDDEYIYNLNEWLNNIDIDMNMFNLKDPSILSSVVVFDRRSKDDLNNVKNKFRAFDCYIDTNEVLDHVISRIFSLANEGKPKNVLTQGYRNADQTSDRVNYNSKRAGISNFYINTNVNLFLTSPWKSLHQS